MIRKLLTKVSGICFLLMILALFSHTASAQTVISDTDNNLSTEETNTIQSACDTILDRYDTSVYLLLTKGQMNQKKYNAYVAKLKKDAKTPKNLILLYVAKEKKESFVQVSALGSIQEKLTQKRCEKMASQVKKRLKKGDSYSALSYFTDQCRSYLEVKPTLDGFFYQSVPQAVLCILFAAAFVYYMLYIKNKGVSPTLATYMIDNASHMTKVKETLRSTSQKRKPKGFKGFKDTALAFLSRKKPS